MTMKTLKRVKRRAISVLMTGALVATMLTGCGSSSDAGSSSGAGSSSEAGGTTDLSKVELTVGTSGTYAPFSYFKEDGNGAIMEF